MIEIKQNLNASHIAVPAHGMWCRAVMSDQGVDIFFIASDLILRQHRAKKDSMGPTIFIAQTIWPNKAIGSRVLNCKVNFFERLPVKLGLPRKITSFQRAVDPICCLFVGPP